MDKYSTSYNNTVNEFLKEFEAIWSNELKELNINSEQLKSGSRLRPLMVLWGYLANINDFSEFDAKYIADISISIEFIHKASILIDDWIDSDETRHNLPTFHKEFSPEFAVMFAMKLISLSVFRLDNILSNSLDKETYINCINIVHSTLKSMSFGAFEELNLNETTLLDLEKIKEIAYLETADIIGDSLKLGYYANAGTSDEIATILKKMGNQCGYIFQALNDLEAFYNAEYIMYHKGSVNIDIECSRKNIAIALLYKVANKNDKKTIENNNFDEIHKLIKKYEIVEFIHNEMELVYKQLIEYTQLLMHYGVNELWINAFISFLELAKKDALVRLGLNS